MHTAIENYSWYVWEMLTNFNKFNKQRITSWAECAYLKKRLSKCMKCIPPHWDAVVSFIRVVFGSRICIDAYFKIIGEYDQLQAGKGRWFYIYIYIYIWIICILGKWACKVGVGDWCLPHLWRVRSCRVRVNLSSCPSSCPSNYTFSCPSSCSSSCLSNCLSTCPSNCL